MAAKENAVLQHPFCDPRWSMPQTDTRPIASARPERSRRDGWTAERQLRSLAALARTRSVTRAAAFAGMSRESAYRLRNREAGALFAALWDRAVKGHKAVSSRHSESVPKPPIFRENAPKACLEPSRKVTKWRKWKDPRFHSLDGQLRDPEARAPCPLPPRPPLDNPACNEARRSRAGQAPSGC